MGKHAWLFLAACGSAPAPSPDAPLTGPQTITIGTHVRGVVTSTPAGITCGTCSLAVPTMCPNPPTPDVCAADFDVGTSVTLALRQQDIFFAAICTSADDPNFKSCMFDVTRPITIDVNGAEALQ